MTKQQLFIFDLVWLATAHGQKVRGDETHRLADERQKMFGSCCLVNGAVKMPVSPPSAWGRVMQPRALRPVGVAPRAQRA
jgi:hypothetical protein